MTLREWMNTFFGLNAPFDDLTIYEAVTGKKISNTLMGDQRWIPQEALDRKVSSWMITKRPYQFIVAVEPKEEGNGNDT